VTQKRVTENKRETKPRAADTLQNLVSRRIKIRWSHREDQNKGGFTGGEAKTRKLLGSEENQKIKKQKETSSVKGCSGRDHDDGQRGRVGIRTKSRWVGGGRNPSSHGA